MKRAYKILIIILIPPTLLIFAEIGKRITVFLRTKDYRFLLYNEKIVFAPIRNLKDEPLLKPLHFSYREKDEKKLKQYNAILFGSSVMGSLGDHLIDSLRKENIRPNKEYYTYFNLKPTLHFGRNTIIVLESLVIPFAYNFFHRNGAARKLLGENLYNNLYHNSVLFLHFSEKFLVPRISFSEEMIDKFMQETLPVFEETFKNVKNSKAPVLYVIFPNKHLRSEDKYFSRNCGKAIDLFIQELQVLIQKYQIKTCNIYRDHGNEFLLSDFRDDHHFNDPGSVKVSRYIVDSMKQNFKAAF